jgi:hypothetical protein
MGGWIEAAPPLPGGEGARRAGEGRGVYGIALRQGWLGERPSRPGVPWNWGQGEAAGPPSPPSKQYSS